MGMRVSDVFEYNCDSRSFTYCMNVNFPEGNCLDMTSQMTTCFISYEYVLRKPSTKFYTSVISDTCNNCRGAYTFDIYFHDDYTYTVSRKTTCQPKPVTPALTPSPSTPPVTPVTTVPISQSSTTVIPSTISPGVPSSSTNVSPSNIASSETPTPTMPNTGKTGTQNPSDINNSSATPSIYVTNLPPSYIGKNGTNDTGGDADVSGENLVLPITSIALFLIALICTFVYYYIKRAKRKENLDMIQNQTTNGKLDFQSSSWHDGYSSQSYTISKSFSSEYDEIRSVSEQISTGLEHRTNSTIQLSEFTHIASDSFVTHRTTQKTHISKQSECISTFLIGTQTLTNLENLIDEADMNHRKVLQTNNYLTNQLDGKQDVD